MYSLPRQYLSKANTDLAVGASMRPRGPGRASWHYFYVFSGRTDLCHLFVVPQ